MRILMISGFYDITFGSSTVIEQLANQLVLLGHEVTISAFVFKNQPSRGGYSVVKIPNKSILELQSFLNSYDIIHSHHPLANYLCFFSKKPFVYHYHGAPNSGKLNQISMLLSIILTRNHINAVIGVSRTATSELQRHFDRKKICTIYNGVNTSVFNPNLKKKYKMRFPQLLFVGKLYSHKNVKELIIATKKLLRFYPETLLQVVGSGQMYVNLQNLVSDLELQDNVVLLDRISSQELPYYYASCDVYVTASKWELFGLPLLEAMACGKPVVASSIPSHIELLTISKGGETYELGNPDLLCEKVMQVLRNKKYFENGLEFANKNAWPCVADRTLKLYKMVTSK